MLAERAAATLTAEELAEVFNRAYSDYYVPLHLDAAMMSGMIAAQDLDLAGSRVLVDGGEAVAFAMLGVRGDRGWIGGMGVVPGQRRRGLGRRAMHAVLGVARERGLARVLLEVLEPNEPAAALYRELGFRDLRWLEILERPAEAADAPGRSQPLAAGHGAVMPGTIEECLAAYGDVHPEAPPWQREPVVLARSSASLEVAVTRGGDGALRAFAIARAVPNRVLFLAAGERAAGGGLAACIGHLLAAHARSEAMMVNVPERDPAVAVLKSLGFTRKLRQREMALPLG